MRDCVLVGCNSGLQANAKLRVSCTCADAQKAARIPGAHLHICQRHDQNTQHAGVLELVCRCGRGCWGWEGSVAAGKEAAKRRGVAARSPIPYAPNMLQLPARPQAHTAPPPCDPQRWVFLTSTSRSPACARLTKASGADVVAPSTTGISYLMRTCIITSRSETRQVGLAVAMRLAVAGGSGCRQAAALRVRHRPRAAPLWWRAAGGQSGV